jgi:hypothetical protein
MCLDSYSIDQNCYQFLFFHHDIFCFYSFDNGGNIAIYDGTNSTVARRKMVADYIEKHVNIKYLL